MWVKKICRLVMRITVSLNIKWRGDNTSPQNPDQPDNSKVDITQLWYDAFNSGSGSLVLDSGKVYEVNDIKSIPVNGKVSITSSGTERATLIVGKENYVPYLDEGQDSHLFTLKDGAEVIVKNVNVCMKPQSNKVQERYRINWFNSVQDANAKWTVLVKDCDTTVNGLNGGLGTGFVYGGNEQNHIAFINYVHSGPMLMELKNPYPGSVLYSMFKDVTTNYKDPSQYSSNSHLTKGIIGNDNVLNLTGEADATSLYSYFFNVDKGANRSFIAHIGRFTFMIDTVDAVIDRKNIQLRPAPIAGDKVLVKGGRMFFGKKEAHAGDSLKVNGVEYKLTRKLKTEWDEWTNNWYQGQYPMTAKSPALQYLGTIADGEYTIEQYQSSFNLKGSEQDLYLINKSDQNFITTESTQFGDGEILLSRPFHIAYNHTSISMYAENVTLDGYYRESTEGKGNSLGYNIINSTIEGQFTGEPKTDIEISERIKNLI